MIFHHSGFFLAVVISFWKETSENPLRSIRFTETDDCECGRYNEFASRIVGGEETEPNLHPWMVAIFNNGRIHCGGSLINDKYILTAGHCLKWVKKENISVVLGLHDRTMIENFQEGGTIAEIEDIIVHENFSSKQLHDTDDIGLIELKEPVEFNSEIRPVCLPKKGVDYANQKALVTGWGKTSEKGYPSRLLRKADVTVLSNSECKEIETIGKHIEDSMLCAYEDKVDACQGDSGGPLILEKDDLKTVQIGVVSWGIGCAQPGMPGVYTRITLYLDWIARHTIDALYCTNPT